MDIKCTDALHVVRHKQLSTMAAIVHAVYRTANLCRNVTAPDIAKVQDTLEHYCKLAASNSEDFNQLPHCL